MKIIKRLALETMFYIMLGLMMLGLITMGTMSGAIGLLMSIIGISGAIWSSMIIEEDKHEH